MKGALNMARRATNTEEIEHRPRPTTDEGYAKGISQAALDRIWDRIERNEASGQELIFAAKLGLPERERELELSSKQMKLVDAKVDALSTAKNTEIMYQEAIKAIKSYSGETEDEDV